MPTIHGKKISIITIGVIILLMEFIAEFSFASTIALTRTSSLPTIDVYRTEQFNVQFFKSCYGMQIQKLSQIMYQKDFFTSAAIKKEFNILKQRIITAIKLQGHFAFVDVALIRYPEENVAHCTIDVIDANDSQRQFHFLAKPNEIGHDPAHLIQHWKKYLETGFMIFGEKNAAPIFSLCPAQHCIFGFEDKRLQKYEKLFTTLVPIYKPELVKILRTDRNSANRAAAAYLLAHIKESHQLVKLLLPSIFDSEEEVRNAVMRVIGSVIAKDHGIEFPMAWLPRIIDFPATSDRNKALGIIRLLVIRKKYADYIKAHCIKYLLFNLKLYQPNLHNLAYDILKKISGKQYDAHDYEAWQNWAKSI